jgi:N-methylhydantoinase B
LAELAQLPNGTYHNTMQIDGYDAPLELVAAVTISDTGLHVDFDGTSAESRYGINVPLSYTTAYTCFGLSCIVSSEIPNNAGSLAPLTVSAPSGCILNAQKPAAVSSRHVVGQLLPDVVFGCLRQAAPERVPAEGTSCLYNLNLRGRNMGANDSGAGYVVTAVTNGGTGARPTKDGLSATAYPSGVRASPIEIMESIAPLVFWRKELRPDSGGHGEFSGGHGQVIEIEGRNEQEFELLAAFDRIDNPPRGHDGGRDGANGRVTLSSGKVLKGKGFQEIPPGERLIVETPGGAGIGAPSKRDAAAIASDLRDGLISDTAAQEFANARHAGGD